VAATMRVGDSVSAPAGPPLREILQAREGRPGWAVTVQAGSGMHRPGAAVTVANRVEADQ
jgi:hypothetical protein